MKRETKVLLTIYLQNKNYIKYNELMDKEIKNVFIKKIQEKEPTFVYSVMIKMLEYVKKHLTEYENYICEQFYIIQQEKMQPQARANELTEIYRKIIKI